MFRRMRLIANSSAIIEDVEELGRVRQLLSILKPARRRFNDVVGSWGGAATACDISASFTALGSGAACGLPVGRWHNDLGFALI